MHPAVDQQRRRFWLQRLAVLMVFCAGCESKTSRAVTDTNATNAAWQTFISPDTLPADSLSVAAIEFNEIRPAETAGTQACISCHQAQYESYLTTSHSRSARELGIDHLDHLDHLRNGPAVATPDRRFAVSTANNRLVHQEYVYGVDQKLIAANAAQMRYEIGSGAHAHSYLFSSNGFLIQSPLTWYSSKKQWLLSPGYDVSGLKPAFDRVVTTNCVFCHVGSIQTHDHYQERFEIKEVAVGCERCHGAGQKHIQIHRQGNTDSASGIHAEGASSKDRIINPKTLSRELNEAICSQCHLQGIVASGSDGANRWDYQPGEPLGNMITEFQLYGREAGFRIVGHTEQMRHSKCYQNSETLTCTSCHDPHGHTSPSSAAKSNVAQRLSQCVACHQNDDCDVPLTTRTTTQQNDCTACHMPKRDTNVPHAALHDHRIAVHPESFRLGNLPLNQTRVSENPVNSGKPRLQAIIDDFAVPEWQRQRRWALAMHTLASTGQMPNEMRDDLHRAERKLVELYQQGLADSNLLVTLSRDYLAAEKTSTARKLAEAALKIAKPGTPSHLGAMDVLAQLSLREQDNQAAITWFRKLTEYRRLSGDFIMLAFCENNAGNRKEAIKLLETALKIDPLVPFAHQLMATVLEADGQFARAQTHKAVLAQFEAGSR